MVLTPGPQHLAPLTVRAPAEFVTGKMEQMERRRRMGFGQFLTRIDQVRRRRGVNPPPVGRSPARLARLDDSDAGTVTLEHAMVCSTALAGRDEHRRTGQTAQASNN